MYTISGSSFALKHKHCVKSFNITKLTHITNRTWKHLCFQVTEMLHADGRNIHPHIIFVLASISLWWWQHWTSTLFTFRSELCCFMTSNCFFLTSSCLSFPFSPDFKLFLFSTFLQIIHSLLHHFPIAVFPNTSFSLIFCPWGFSELWCKCNNHFNPSVQGYEEHIITLTVM